MAPPDILTQPICEDRRFHSRDQVTQPLSLLHPTLDGVVTDFFEWRGAGTINPNPPLGAMWKADGLFSTIAFGCDLDHLFLRLDPDTSLQGKYQHLQIECLFHTPAHHYRLLTSLPSSDRYTLAQRQEDGSWRDIASSPLVSWNKILEMAVPFKELRVEEGQTLTLNIVVQEHGMEIARYPRYQPVSLTVPGPEFEATVWRV